MTTNDGSENATPTGADTVTEAAASSVAPEVTNVDVSTNDANQDAAQSSGADAEQGAKTSKDAPEKRPLIDVVRDAVKGKDTSGAEQDAKSPVAKTDQVDGEAQAEASGDTGPDKEDLDADGKPLPFHNHPRWQEVKKERDTFKAEAATYKESAQQYETITAYMAQKNLVADEVAQGFQVMDLVKNDPEAALQYFEQAADILRQQVGKALPADLMEAVNTGEISEERAEELSVARSRQSRTEASLQAERQRANQAAQQQQQTQAAAAVRAAIGTWEKDVAKRDPDYSKKSKAVIRYAGALRAEAVARGENVISPQRAVSLAQQAYDEVTKDFRAARPRPATDLSPTGSVSVKPAAPAAPKSVMEAVRMGASMPVQPNR